MFRSIRWRLTIPFISVFLITMLALGIYLTNLVRQARIDALRTFLASEARLLSEALITTPFTEENTAILDSLAKDWSANLNARVTLIKADGLVLGESQEDRAVMDNLANRPEVQAALADGEGSSVRFSQTIGADLLYMAIPHIQEGQPVGVIRLAIPLQAVDASIAEIRRAILIATFIATLILAALAVVIAERTTRPLRQLTADSLRMAAGDTPAGLHPTSQDEVGKLARAMNLMARRLQKQAQARETERGKLAAILRQMTNGVVMIDPDGLVGLLNASAERMFNTRETDALGKSLVEVLRHHQLVALWQASRMSGEGEVIAIELPQKRLYLQAVATPLDGLMAGHTLLLFQDLTRTRQLETIRKDFISNISHELRTPLASLKALTETLLDGAMDDPPAAQRFLTRIETEVDSLALMVQELLELARIESGRVPIQFQEIPPRKLVHNAVERLVLQAERSALEVEIQCDESLPDVLADPPRMEQVLMNLLHNAIKYTPSGGKITLRASCPTSFEGEDPVVLFEVEDNGVGIPAQDLPRIFERFYKADPSRSGGGTGLGLAISRHLVEAHQGRIWAESVEGQGSTFYFTLKAVKTVAREIRINPIKEE